MPEDGILKQSGFQPGDVIRAVNGTPVTDPSMMLKLAAQLKTTAVIQVQVERDGHPFTLTYRMQ